MRDDIRNYYLKPARPSEYTNLLQAAHQGDVEEVKRLLLSDLDVNHQVAIEGQMGRTALVEAVRNKHIEVVKVLLANGAKVNLIDDSSGKSVFELAEEAGDPVVIRLIEIKRFLENVENEEAGLVSYWILDHSSPKLLFKAGVRLRCLTLLMDKLSENPKMVDELKGWYRERIREIYFSIVSFSLRKNCFQKYANVDLFYNALSDIAADQSYKLGGSEAREKTKRTLEKLGPYFRRPFITDLCSQLAQRTISQQALHNTCDVIIASESLQDSVKQFRRVLTTCCGIKRDRMGPLVTEFVERVFSDAAVVDRFLQKDLAFRKKHIYETDICDGNESIKSAVEARFAERIHCRFEGVRKVFERDNAHWRNTLRNLVERGKKREPLPGIFSKLDPRERLGEFERLLSVQRSSRYRLNEKDRETLDLVILKNSLLSEIGDKLHGLFVELGSGIDLISVQTAKNFLSNLTTSKSRLHDKANKFIRVAEMLCDETADFEKVLNEAIEVANISTSHAKGSLKTSGLYRRLVAMREKLTPRLSSTAEIEGPLGQSEEGAPPITVSVTNGWRPCVDGVSTSGKEESNPMLDDLCDVGSDEVVHHEGELEVQIVDPKESAGGQGNYVEGTVISVSDEKNGKQIPLSQYWGAFFASRQKENLESSFPLVEVVGAGGDANEGGVASAGGVEAAAAADGRLDGGKGGVCEWDPSVLPVAPSGSLFQEKQSVNQDVGPDSSSQKRVAVLMPG